MERQQMSIRVGITAILCAVVLKFFSLGGPGWLRDQIRSPELTAFLIYMESGLQMRLNPKPGEEAPRILAQFPEPDLFYPPESPAAVPPPLPRFTDPGLVDLTYLCPYAPDIPYLLRKPLTWDLKSGAPTVLIFHTHTTESYEKGEKAYAESAPYRTLDPQYNVLSIGDRITALLEQSGITVIHDRAYYDYPDYNGCYGRTRKAAAEYLKEYPTLRQVLDLHRDACDSTAGQLRTHALVDGRDSAQLMIVAVSNASGPSHRHWAENLSLALKLQAQLQTQCPGIARPLSFRPQRFNQDLSPGALLIEVGGAGNTHEEALLAADQLAGAIIALSGGTGEDPALKEPGPGPGV